jgi:hypothetical protein
MDDQPPLDLGQEHRDLMAQMPKDLGRRASSSNDTAMERDCPTGAVTRNINLLGTFLFQKGWMTPMPLKPDVT